MSDPRVTEISSEDGDEFMLADPPHSREGAIRWSRSEWGHVLRKHIRCYRRFMRPWTSEQYEVEGGWADAMFSFCSKHDDGAFPVWHVTIAEHDTPYPSTHKMTLADEGNMEC